MENYSGIDGTTAASYPSVWYAFNAGGARFYILNADWNDNNFGTAAGGAYQVDRDYHWQPTSPEYQWLKADLESHGNSLKLAFFHYPLRSDSATEGSDGYLQGDPNNPSSIASLEGLLANNGVDLAFNGHAHLYQRNLAPPGGVTSYVTGGGGAKVTPVSQEPVQHDRRLRRRLGLHQRGGQRLRSGTDPDLGRQGVPLPQGDRQRHHGHRDADRLDRRHLRPGHLQLRAERHAAGRPHRAAGDRGRHQRQAQLDGQYQQRFQRAGRLPQRPVAGDRRAGGDLLHRRGPGGRGQLHRPGARPGRQPVRRQRAGQRGQWQRHRATDRSRQPERHRDRVDLGATGLDREHRQRRRHRLPDLPQFGRHAAGHGGRLGHRLRRQQRGRRDDLQLHDQGQGRGRQRLDGQQHRDGDHPAQRWGRRHDHLRQRRRHDRPDRPGRPAERDRHPGDRRRQPGEQRADPVRAGPAGRLHVGDRRDGSPSRSAAAPTTTPARAGTST